jgi:heme/copper-type cytochrome/quinol oxidase subunit 2
LQRSIIGALPAVLGGCQGVQSALQPGGSGAAAIYQLWLLFLYVCAGVFVVVMAAMLAALLLRRDTVTASELPALDQDTPAERRLNLLLKIGTGITVAILATIAVTAKNVAVRLAGADGPVGAGIHTAIEIGGAAFVLIVGLLLLSASLMA